MHIKVNETKILAFYQEKIMKHPSPKMTLRVNHIVNDVVRYAGLIAGALGLDNYGKEMMKAVAYLHDYYQVLQIADNAPNPHLHHSDPDALEMVLFGNNQIDEYVEGLTDYDRMVIKTAIVWHAKIAVDLPFDTDPTIVLFCHIIRDADKAAIYELIQDPLYVLRNDWGFSDEQIVASAISQRVLDDFMSGRCVTNSDIKEPADWAISQLGYLYDIKTNIALGYLLKSATSFVSNLPFSEEINRKVRGCFYHAMNRMVLR